MQPKPIRLFSASIALAGMIMAQFAQAQTIIDEWNSITAPPPPPLKAVTIDKNTTALVLIDYNVQSCNMQRRPRCVASLPKIKELLERARSAGLTVAFTLGGGSKPTDLVKELTRHANDPIVLSGLDKFYGTDLEHLLKAKGITTLIMVGAASHGAVLYTVNGAVTRGFKVIVPIDGIAAENLYAEQYSVWHLGNAPVVSLATTLTTLQQITF